MDPVSGAVLSGLVTEVLKAGSGSSWRKLREQPEDRALRKVIEEALREAVDQSRRPGTASDAEWWRLVAELLTDAFTSKLIRSLLVEDSPDQLRQELTGRGMDLRQLEGLLDVDLFLSSVQRLLRAGLTRAAYEDEALRTLVILDDLQHLKKAAQGPAQATDDQLRRVLPILLQEIEDDAARENLPSYLPPDSDLTRLNRDVRVRPDIRRPTDEPPNPTSQAHVQEVAPSFRLTPTAIPWKTFAADNRRVMLLADPGLGKSWLVRAECARLAAAARTILLAGVDPTRVAIPVMARCDEVVRADGRTLGAALSEIIGRRHRLDPAVVSWLSARIDDGEAAVLLDALDELPGRAAERRLHDLLGQWPGGRRSFAGQGRLLITSRIAGYSGAPLRTLTEIELMPFGRSEIEQLLASWGLPDKAEQKLRDRLRDPAVFGMATIPLLMALLCATANDAAPLPSRRWQLYERVVLHFLSIDRAVPSGAGRRSAEVDDLLDLLGEVALHFANRPEGWADLMAADDLLEFLAGKAGVDASRVLQALVTETGLLTSAGTQAHGQRPPYLFVHRTVAEYLVSRQLRKLPLDELLRVIHDHLWFDPSWVEVIPMCGGQLRDPARLLDHLLALEDDPGCHALYAAGRILGELPRAKHREVGPQLQQVLDRLMLLLNHFPVPDRSALVQVLQTMPPAEVDRAVAATLEAGWWLQWLRPLVSRLVASPEATVLRQAVLAQFRDSEGYERRRAAEVLADASVYGDVRAAALAAPASSNGVTAIPDPGEIRSVLWQRLEDEVEPAARRDVIRALTGQEYLPREYHRLLAKLRLNPRNEELVSRAILAAESGELIPVLIEILVDSGLPDTVRTMAAMALGRADDSRVERELLPMLAGPAAPFAVEALLPSRGERQRRFGLEIRRALCQLATDPTYEARPDAISALGGVLEDDQVRAELLPLFADESPGIRYALVCMSENVALYPEFLPGCVSLLGESNWVRRLAGVESLAPVVDRADVRASLLNCLSDPAPAVRNASATELMGFADPELIASTLIGVLDDPDVQDSLLHRMTIDSLAQLVDRADVRDRLLEATRHDESRIRERAVYALAGAVNVPEVRDRLLQLLVWGRGNSSAVPAAIALTAAADDQDVFRWLLGFATSGRLDTEFVDAFSSVSNQAGGVSRLQLACELIRDTDSATKLGAQQVLMALAERGYRELPPDARAAVHRDLAEVARLRWDEIHRQQRPSRFQA